MSGRKGGVLANVDDLGRGGGRPPTGRPNPFRSPYWSPTSPPPSSSTDVGITINFAFSTFLSAIRSGRLWTGVGGGVFQTDDVGQGGGGQKSQFLLGRL